MARSRIGFGIIGCGLMGREVASSIARWCSLLSDIVVPELRGICDVNEGSFPWFREHFSSITLATGDYRKLLSSNSIQAIYCAVPHHLHEQTYIDCIRAGKHLLGEKPFGIDQKANRAILKAISENPGVVVRCSSEFPFFPGCQRLIKWIREKQYGRLMEVRSGFHHSSDMDLKKPVNWKRTVKSNGEYGCMGDLGMHTHHVPFRMGWVPEKVFADLQKIVEQRPDKTGQMVPCETWDNAVLTCKCTDKDNNKPFTMVLETKRMAPGATNTWFLEVYGTEGSARFTTADPKSFYYSVYNGSEQGWTRVDLGLVSAFPVISGSIFEFGFSDAVQQMIAAFVNEISGNPQEDVFGCVTPQETALSHKVLTAALESHASENLVPVQYN